MVSFKSCTNQNFLSSCWFLMIQIAVSQTFYELVNEHLNSIIYIKSDIFHLKNCRSIVEAEFQLSWNFSKVESVFKFFLRHIRKLLHMYARFLAAACARNHMIFFQPVFCFLVLLWFLLVLARLLTMFWLHLIILNGLNCKITARISVKYVTWQ